MNKQEQYQSKLVSVEEALSKIKSGDSIMTAQFLNEPQYFMDHLHTIGDRVENVTVHAGTTAKPYPFIVDESLKGKIEVLSTFYAGAVRQAHQQGRSTFMPSFLHLAEGLIVGREQFNVLVVASPPMDEHGFFYFSGSLSQELGCLEQADLVIVEVNPQYPVMYGDTQIPIEKVDCVIEAEYPVFTIPAPKISDVERKIGGYIAELVNDGDTIQLGIGGMPDAAGEALMDKKDLGIYTELITPIMGRLMKAGVVTNERKNFHRGKTIGGIVLGDRELYDVLDKNPMVEMHRSAYVNDPFNVMKNDNLVSVNAAIEIDLTGQICSESMGSTQFSGTGGAFDFAYGAFRSKGGRGVIAISSTAKGGTISKIVPQLTPGAVVSISRNVADHVVTEYGVARLRGKTVGERVKELIAIAHPDFRKDLKKQAEDLKLW